MQYLFFKLQENEIPPEEVSYFHKYASKRTAMLTHILLLLQRAAASDVPPVPMRPAAARQIRVRCVPFSYNLRNNTKDRQIHSISLTLFF